MRYAIFQIIKRDGESVEFSVEDTQPYAAWGPAMDECRRLRTDINIYTEPRPSAFFVGQMIEPNPVFLRFEDRP